MAGPLEGMKIIEVAGIGPGPFAGMVLADFGADVLRIDRRPEPSALPLDPAKDVVNRSKASLVLDLKAEADRNTLRALWAKADGLIEGFRPGVMEGLGLGPDEALKDNPKLVYGRMTGWGQTGPKAGQAGHDINYIAQSGVLGSLGRPGERPAPPLNLIGDYGGGAMLLVAGMLAALMHAQKAGQGQVVDAAMVEGSALLMTPIYAFSAQGFWGAARGRNLLDGGAPFYDVYETADAQFMALGCLEPKFFAEMITLLDIAEEIPPARQYDRGFWPDMRDILTRLFASETQAHWEKLFEGSDACVEPVLDYTQAPSSEHAQARGGFVRAGGLTQPAPAPKFSKTNLAQPSAPCVAGDGGAAMAKRWGLDPRHLPG